MSDIIETFGNGGWFEDAGVNLEDVSEDPFNFGNGYHVVSVQEFRAPKVSETGTGKFGSYIFFEVEEAKYNRLKFGRWIQIPTPKAIQEETGVVFDPHNNHQDMAAASNFMRFLVALGFTKDNFNQANPATCQSRMFLARLFAREEEGQWRVGFGFASIKPMPQPGTEEYNALIPQIQGTGSGESMDGFAGGKAAGNGGGTSAIEAAMAADIENS